jgi:hypothetical protein
MDAFNKASFKYNYDNRPHEYIGVIIFPIILNEQEPQSNQEIEKYVIDMFRELYPNIILDYYNVMVKDAIDFRGLRDVKKNCIFYYKEQCVGIEHLKNPGFTVTVMIYSYIRKIHNAVNKDRILFYPGSNNIAVDLKTGSTLKTKIHMNLFDGLKIAEDIVDYYNEFIQHCNLKITIRANHKQLESITLNLVKLDH